MKLNFSLLKKHLNTDLSFAKIIDYLNAIGFEVENFKDSGKFKIVRIDDIVKHENSDRLQICKVYDGEKHLQIVCGAQNPYVGMYTVLAEIGAVLPNKIIIKESKIRGVVSYGMLCSEDEIGLAVTSYGIIDLKGFGPDNLGEYFFDPVAEISITPNRGYALSILGIARDLSAAGAGSLVQVDNYTLPMQKNDLNFVIENDAFCPFYSYVLIKNVQNKESPYWLRKILSSVGLRSINVVVDLLHYVTLLYGQPMHAYDFAKLGSRLSIKSIKSGKMIGIDSKEYNVSNLNVICDDNDDCHSIAGIIGSKESSCDFATDQILLESAIFSSANIAIAGRKLNINTDARYRFERGVDANLTIFSLQLATKLIKEFCDADVGDINFIGCLPKYEKVIRFDYEYFKSITALSIPIKDVLSILSDLGFSIQDDFGDKVDNFSEVGNIVYVCVPSWMHDIELQESLISEVIRIYGCEKIPESPIINSFSYVYKKSDEDILRNFLAIKGYNEVITWSFTDASKVKQHQDLMLVNPVAKNMNAMRPSIVPNLIDLCNENFAKGIFNICLFEIGTVFHIHDDKITEIDVLSCIKAGKTAERNMYNEGHAINFFDIKSDIVAMMEYFKISDYKIVSERCFDVCDSIKIKTQAALYVKGEKVGFLCEVDNKSMKKNMAFCEIFTNIFFSNKNEFVEFVPSVYQRVFRDFSFVFSCDVVAQDLIEQVKNVDLALIKDVTIFDKYVDKNIKDKIIIGFEVILQANDRTLNSEEIETVSDKIIKLILNSFGGILRRDYSI